MASAVKNPSVALPTLQDKAGTALFKRITSAENLEYNRNKKLPIKERLPDFMVKLQGTAELLRHYWMEGRKNPALHTEVTMLQVQTLHLGVLGSELADEFIPTLQKDDKYQTRMAGLEKIKRGMTQMFTGMETSLSEVNFYQPADFSSMLEAMAATVPRYAMVMSAEEKTSMVKRMSALRPRFKQESDLKSIDIILSALKPQK
ncbi:MAG TPA: hypothetical protein VHM91_18915 [Verrucomicrobiales bacterium]|nr:hypothetical protein [Verrucomicrobiales bacterium]